MTKYYNSNVEMSDITAFCLVLLKLGILKKYSLWRTRNLLKKYMEG